MSYRHTSSLVGICLEIILRSSTFKAESSMPSKACLISDKGSLIRESIIASKDRLVASVVVLIHLTYKHSSND